MPRLLLTLVAALGCCLAGVAPTAPYAARVAPYTLPAAHTPASHAMASRPAFGPGILLADPSRYPASDPDYARQPLPDDEPSVAIAADGTVWAAALHMHYGTALWRGRFGQSPPAFVGMPDHGIGGQDVALAVGDGTPATLVTAALVPITTPITAWRITATGCPAGLIAGDFAACAFYPHLAYGERDRPWLASFGRSTFYLSYVTRTENLLSGQTTFQRSNDGGRTWTIVGDPVAGLGPGIVHGWPGPIAVDPRSGAVYEVFVVEGTPQPGLDRYNRLVVAISRDRGATWRDVTAYQGGPGEDDAHMWPGLAVDAAGRLYAAWSDGRDAYLVSSTDSGASWSTPIRVDTPSALLRVSLMPWVAAGAAGHVALAWYGTDAVDGLSARAGWRVWFAESFDGGRSFAQAPASGLIHRGPVCAKGDACPWLQRQLLDNLGLALDPRTGRAAIVYARSIDFGDFRACFRAANCPQTYYVEESAVRR